MSGGSRAEIVVDLDAIGHNVSTLRALTGVAMITVVKADAYGHGMLPVARAARAAGAEWLAVATLDEVRRLRAAGDTGRLLTWLTVPDEQYDHAIRADVDLTAYSVAELDEIAAAATHVGAPARVQLKVDTGLSRGGAARADWEPFLARARAGEQAGQWKVTGIWSHFACADEPAHPANDAQQAAFDDALALADDIGLTPEIRHLANSAAAILRPQSRYDAVRVGLATYGLDPAPGVDHGTDLRVAMTVRAELALVKQLEAGDAVSYGHTWTAPERTTIGLVPAGYAEGVPVAGSNRLEVTVDGKRRPVRGRVCMDQVLVDLGGDTPPEGSEVVLFGPPGGGRATAQDWAEACGTINYEIVTRIGGRMTRRYTGATS
ncbi:alanine racemase [Nocardioides plantarum]|uniref:Alanine racemase n=1 Tax=Nocardioides plantarum TaxID=29299 RepID=A0ABV5KAJ1_9ACTN|nr:alanine racemase [Nocardioides plantarum]